MSSVRYTVATEYTDDQSVIDAVASELSKFGKVSVVVTAPKRIYTARSFDEDIFDKDSAALLSKFLVGHNNRYFNGHGLVYDALRNDSQQDDVLCKRPLYMYAHSGVALSHAPFSCPWDSGQVGVHVVLKSDLAACGFSESEITPEFGESILDDELKFVDAYVRGDLYDVTVDDEEGDTIDIFTVNSACVSESLYGKNHPPLSDEQRQVVSEVEAAIRNSI